jgi:hypothetical protein
VKPSDSAEARPGIFSRIGYFLKVLWLLIGVLLILLIAVDALLKRRVRDPWLTQTVVDGAKAPARESSEANDAADLAYWKDHANARTVRWRSGVYFRRTKFASKTINIDAHGFRVTANVVNRAAPEVWVFGGSTVWGTGVMDAHTPASLLQAALPQYRVLNFAESGYVSAQNQQAFMQALRCGGKPVAAVFIDGINDVYAALQAKRAGLSQNEANRALEFNMASDHAKWTELFRGLRGLSQPEVELPQPDALARDITHHYLQIVDETHALARARGIPAIFIWQPSLFDKTKLSTSEQKIIDASPAMLQRLMRASTQSISQQLHREREFFAATASPELNAYVPNLHDTDATRFFDYSHTGLAGNQALAAQLAWDVALHGDAASARASNPCESVPLR